MSDQLSGEQLAFFSMLADQMYKEYAETGGYHGAVHPLVSVLDERYPDWAPGSDELLLTVFGWRYPHLANVPHGGRFDKKRYDELRDIAFSLYADYERSQTGPVIHELHAR